MFVAPWWVGRLSRLKGKSVVIHTAGHEKLMLVHYWADSGAEKLWRNSPGSAWIDVFAKKACVFGHLSHQPSPPPPTLRHPSVHPHPSAHPPINPSTTPAIVLPHSRCEGIKLNHVWNCLNLNDPWPLWSHIGLHRQVGGASPAGGGLSPRWAVLGRAGLGWAVRYNYMYIYICMCMQGVCVN